MSEYYFNGQNGYMRLEQPIALVTGDSIEVKFNWFDGSLGEENNIIFSSTNGGTYAGVNKTPSVAYPPNGNLWTLNCSQSDIFAHEPGRVETVRWVVDSDTNVDYWATLNNLTSKFVGYILNITITQNHDTTPEVYTYAIDGGPGIDRIAPTSGQTGYDLILNDMPDVYWANDGQRPARIIDHAMKIVYTNEFKSKVIDHAMKLVYRDVYKRRYGNATYAGLDLISLFRDLNDPVTFYVQPESVLLEDDATDVRLAFQARDWLQDAGDTCQWEIDTGSGWTDVAGGTEPVLVDTNIPPKGEFYFYRARLNRVNDLDTHYTDVATTNVASIDLPILPEELPVLNHNAESGLDNWSLRSGSMIQTRTSSPSPVEGTAYFQGPSAVEGRAGQIIDLPAEYDAFYDSQYMTLNLNFMHSSYSGADEGVLGVQPLDGNGDPIGDVLIHATKTMNNQVWKERNCYYELPLGTRKVDILIDTFRRSGSNLDFYVDVIKASFFYSHSNFTNWDYNNVVNPEVGGTNTPWVLTGSSLVDTRSGNSTVRPLYGQSLFMADNDVSPAYAHVSLDVKDAAALVAKGQYAAKFVFRGGTTATAADADTVEVKLREFDGEGGMLNETVSGALTHTNGMKHHEEAAYEIPITADSDLIEVELEWIRSGGSANNMEYHVESIGIVLEDLTPS